MKNIYIKKYEEFKFMPKIIYKKSNSKIEKLKEKYMNLNFSSTHKNWNNNRKKWSFVKSKNESNINLKKNINNLKNIFKWDKYNIPNLNIVNKDFSKNILIKNKYILNYFKNLKISNFKSNSKDLFSNFNKNWKKKKKLVIMKKSKNWKNKSNSKIQNKKTKSKVTKSINNVNFEIIKKNINKVKSLKDNNINDFLKNCVDKTNKKPTKEFYNKISKIGDLLKNIKKNESKNVNIQTNINIPKYNKSSISYIHSILNNYSKILLKNIKLKDIHLKNNLDLYNIKSNENLNKVFLKTATKLYFKNNILEELCKILNEGEVEIEKLFEYVYNKFKINITDESKSIKSNDFTCTYLSELTCNNDSQSKNSNKKPDFNWCFDNLEKYETTSENEEEQS